MNYYISDMHLFHENSIRFDNRPFVNLDDMHETIKTKWNSKITNGDNVYILGDISFRGKTEDLIAYISTLKGHKILVKGNHDDVSDYRYRQLFEEVCDYKEIHDSVDGKNYNLVLCHYPIFSWENMGKGSVLLYGHTHSSEEDDYFQRCLADMINNDCRHVYKAEVMALNVGCMKKWMNYEPRTLKEILYETAHDKEKGKLIVRGLSDTVRRNFAYMFMCGSDFETYKHWRNEISDKCEIIDNIKVNTISKGLDPEYIIDELTWHFDTVGDARLFVEYAWSFNGTSLPSLNDFEYEDFKNFQNFMNELYEELPYMLTDNNDRTSEEYQNYIDNKMQEHRR